MTARIQALGTAMPDHYVFKQSEIVEGFFARQPGWDPAWAEVFENSGVERRASVVDAGYLADPGSTADRMRIFAPAARKLGAEAARRALDRAGPDAAAEVADLLAVSCTGYTGPGWTSTWSATSSSASGSSAWPSATWAATRPCRRCARRRP